MSVDIGCPFGDTTNANPTAYMVYYYLSKCVNLLGCHADMPIRNLKGRPDAEQLITVLITTLGHLRDL